MKFKKFEKPHKNAKFQAKRAVMKQDETVKTQIHTMHTNRLFKAAGGLFRPKRWLRRYHYPCFYCSATKTYPDGRGPGTVRMS